MGRDTAIRVPVIGEDLRGIKTSINRREAKYCAEHKDVARELEAVLNTQTEQAGPSILDNIAEAGRFGEEPAEKEGDYVIDVIEEKGLSMKERIMNRSEDWHARLSTRRSFERTQAGRGKNG